MITPVVLAGGSGARLWPLSRAMYPKQFLPLNSDVSMLQETLLRLKGLSVSTPHIVCNEEHRFLVAEHVRQLNLQAKIMLEPVGKNTAPAIALSALELAACGQSDALMLVLPADHVINDTNTFQSAVTEAASAAEAGAFVTFGIVPTEPATGYGYIRFLPDHNDDAVALSVQSFVEKPDQAVARDYIASGEYYWNSGMFMVRVDRYLEELKSYRPDILKVCEQSMLKATHDHDFIRVDSAVFAECPEDSVDYAVMEPLCGSGDAGEVLVVPLDAGWSDVGSLSALCDIKRKDSNGNVVEGDVILEQTRNCFVHGQDRLVATVGLKDLVIVDTKDALLVASKGSVQDVRSVVHTLKGQERPEYLQHREVYRPWGKFDSIDEGDRYLVKHITVNPGEKLSLQKHHHRAEHWVVVSGAAEVRCGDKLMRLSENQSTYIPLGETHQLRNPGEVPLEIIEIQSGAYLGEDDIIRYADEYGRI